MSDQSNNRRPLAGRLRSLFTFSAAERRGIVWFLPLLAVVAAVLIVANRPRFEKSFLQVADMEIGGGNGHAGRENPSRPPSGDPGGKEAELFPFDPNTATLGDFVRLGLDARTGAGIIKYREKGKRFEIPEDLAACYGVTIEQYERLEPYIIIGNEFRLKRKKYGSDKNKGANESILAPFDPNALSAEGFAALGFSPAQAAVIVKYRETVGGFLSAEDFARCYVVSERQMERLAPFMDIAAREDRQQAAGTSGAAHEKTREKAREKIELNAADSAALRSVSGIGEVLVVRILDYRRRLGGFHSAAQLAEVQGMTEANWERIAGQIFVDSCVIQKIDINFASHKNLVDALGGHPYMTDTALRKLLKQRQLKGGWSSIADMVDQNILTRAQAEKLAPYLVFRAEK